MQPASISCVGMAWATRSVEMDDRDLHLVDNWRLTTPADVQPPDWAATWWRGAGPTLRFTRTTADPGRDADRLTLPFGSGDFGQARRAGLFAMGPPLQHRHQSDRGISAEIGGRVMPAVWDVDSTYGTAHAAVTGRLAAGGALQPSLSLRVRGEHIFGTAPFFDLATLGGTGSLRGFSQERFRGDRSLAANTEARIRLARGRLILPTDIGVMGIGDVGRVFLEGESSDVWHAAAGGGVWLSWLDGHWIALNLASGQQRAHLAVRRFRLLVLRPGATTACGSRHWREPQRAADRSAPILSTYNRFEIYWSGGDDLGQLASAAPIRVAIADADVVVFAVWFDAIKGLIAQHTDLLRGKILVVDPSNAIKLDGEADSPRPFPRANRPAPVIAGLLPAARTTSKPSARSVPSPWGLLPTGSQGARCCSTRPTMHGPPPRSSASSRPQGSIR